MTGTNLSADRIAEILGGSLGESSVASRVIVTAPDSKSLIQVSDSRVTSVEIYPLSNVRLRLKDFTAIFGNPQRSESRAGVGTDVKFMTEKLVISIMESSSIFPRIDFIRIELLSLYGG